MKRNVIGVLVVLAIVACFFVSSVFNHQAQASTPRLSLAITSVAATDHKASHVGKCGPDDHRVVSVYESYCNE